MIVTQPSPAPKTHCLVDRLYATKPLARKLNIPPLHSPLSIHHENIPESNYEELK